MRMNRTAVLSLAVIAMLATSGCLFRKRTSTVVPTPASDYGSLYDASGTSSAFIPLTPLGVELTSEVGAVVYTHGQRRFTTPELVTFNEAGVFLLDGGHVMSFKAGETTKLKLRKSGGQKAGCLMTERTRSACLVDMDGDGVFETLVFENEERTFPMSKPIRYSVQKGQPEEVRPVYGEIRRELVYSGASGDNLRLSYRELSLDGMARPAFNQDVVYALDAKGHAEVGFKGLRMQVLSATNSKLVYRIEKPMD